VANKTYTLSICFSTKIDIEECVVGFVIETVKGLWVINCNSLNTGAESNFSVKKDTVNKVDFVFEMPQIVNGDYVVGV
ncbi:Wzt carbohydrate-binding domain-containing protein, partial [Enterococcus faecalis]|uniref:Wzt carbohydrate-binding domain-containing protein n=1 Tax=Enterococcus faecalis TaxID=1351 RepID=UPI0039869623